MLKIDEQLFFSSIHINFYGFSMSIYLDCNATTPIEPEVFLKMKKFFLEEYGNASSRTHEYGNKAKKAIQEARRCISNVFNAQTGDKLIFTSGATESNNLCILGLIDYAKKTNKKHVICSAIEHKAVLEPVQKLKSLGFDISFIQPNSDGVVDINELKAALRDDTFLVSIMHVNNETGVIQPLPEICNILKNHPAYFHTDAAQSFGKIINDLTLRRIDFTSISGHKIYGPKGIGALFMRRRKFEQTPLAPIMYGGGQENGLRPGTLPTPLIVGLGKAAEMAIENNGPRMQKCQAYKEQVLCALSKINVLYNGNLSLSLPNVVNFSIPGIDSESAILTLKDVIAVSNGSACTSNSYTSSQVLSAMRLPEDRISGAIRMSWCHMTDNVIWEQVTSKIKNML